MNRDQRTYYSEQKKFADSLDSIEPRMIAETRSYRYASIGFEKYAINSAEAKGDYESYIGIVFAVDRSDIDAMNVTCAGDDASIKAADLVSAQQQWIQNNPDQPSECPPGSYRLP